LGNNKLLYHPNIILIAGAGRNVGKTTLACKIIEHLSKKHDVTGLKISPHIHESDYAIDPLIKSENFIISKEQNNTEKDSSKILKAGAENVYYVQTKQDYLEDAFLKLLPFVSQGPVVCESGGLHTLIKPGLFIFVHKGKEIPENKRSYLEFNPLSVDVFATDTDIFKKNIIFENGKFVYLS